MKSAVLLTAFLFAFGAFAQQPVCTASDTLLSCYQKFNPPPPPKPQVENAADALVKKANTGATTLDGVSATALKDFLSIFAASVDSATVSEKGNAITFDWNLPFAIVNKDERSLKFQAVFTKPEISSDVSSKLGANASAIKTLNDGLTNTDDITASLTYTRVDRSFGRSITPHLPLFDAMLVPLLDSASDDAADDRLRKLLKEHKEIVDAKTPFTNIPKEARDSVIAATEAVARDASRTLSEVDDLTKNFARLLNNQPQIYASMLYHNRKDVVGPSSVSAKLTYEIGTANINRFRQYKNGECGEASVAAHGAACVKELADFTKSNGGLAAEGADRFTLSVEYQQSRTERVDLTKFSEPDPVVTPQSHSVIASATYGRSLMNSGGHDGRVDVKASYENVSKDPTKKDRFVASITLTQQLSDKMSIPLSLVYANHSQFLSNVDRKLNVHFGLSFKVPDLK
jgi:hypothetical protein